MRDDRNNIIDIDDLMDDEPTLTDDEYYDNGPAYDEPAYEDRPRRNRRRDDYDDYDDYEDERPRRRGGIFFSYIFPFVVLAILVVFSILFLREWLTYKAAGDEYALVKEKIVIPEEPEAAEEEFTYPHLDIDFEALLASNSEFVCVLYVPALDLYYPVAQAEDNTKYLTTTFEGTTNPSGCIFLDSVASPDFSDINTFIYGHNMKNETMFGSLKEFSAQEDLCASNPYMYVYLADGTVNKYHIFSYYTTPVSDAVYSTITNDTAYDAYIMRAQSRSYYAPSDEEADDFTLRPNLLTLSTCWGNDHKNNFVVHGALVAAYHEE